MKNFNLTIAIVLFSFIFLYGQNNSNIKSLTGTWTIDLRPTPDSEPYYQYFTISVTKEGTFRGTFYSSNIENALINTAFDQTYLAFKTRDNSNTYYHYVKVVGDRLEGLSYCEGRDLIQPWIGEKQQ